MIGACGTEEEAAEIALTNAARAEAGLSPLRCDPAVGLVARAHSQDMCTRMYFSHRSPDGMGPTARLAAMSVLHRVSGENIAQGQQTPEEAHAAWIGSPGHRTHIESTVFGRIGVGYVSCRGLHYWTQLFVDGDVPL
jgi:uncharacterized protein YkwD